MRPALSRRITLPTREDARTDAPEKLELSYEKRRALIVAHAGYAHALDENTRAWLDVAVIAGVLDESYKLTPLGRAEVFDCDGSNHHSFDHSTGRCVKCCKAFSTPRRAA